MPRRTTEPSVTRGFFRATQNSTRIQILRAATPGPGNARFIPGFAPAARGEAADHMPREWPDRERGNIPGAQSGNSWQLLDPGRSTRRWT